MSWAYKGNVTPESLHTAFETDVVVQQACHLVGKARAGNGELQASLGCNAKTQR